MNYQNHQIKLNIQSIKQFHLRNRFEFSNLCQKLNFKSVLEVGVLFGDFADRLLSNWPSFVKYIGVDPFKKQKVWVDWANKNNNEFDGIYNKTLLRLIKKFGGDRINLMRMKGDEAAALIPDYSIDFVYIDARHDFVFGFKDLKVGQDWSICGNNKTVEGSVRKAVMDFTERNNIHHVFMTGDGLFRSWYFFKFC